METPEPVDNERHRPAAGQRRYVTVLFSDVSDSSQHAEQLEAEEYGELLESFRRFAREVIPRHGGSIARLQGDGVLALFGHLEQREDDGRRAAEAALELHAAVATLRTGAGAAAITLQMHSGIHAGLVLVIEGDIERGRYDVVGEVANTAARLCSVAGRGQIVVSVDTLGPQANFFQTSAPRRVAIRGRSEPLNVLRIDGRAAVGRRIDAAARRGVVAFAGRANALSQLFSVADRAQRGESSLVIVSGEPGIGKTRLIEEFERRLAPAQFQVLQGYCESYLGAEPLQPFMQAIRMALDWRAGSTADENEAAVLQALAVLSAEETPSTQTVRALLGLRTAAGTALPPAAARVAAIVDLLALLASQRTLVLVLDDWQWADDASRQVLETLRGRRLPVLALLAMRSGPDDDPALAGAQTLRLQPLDAGEAERAIAAWLPDAEPFVAQEIYRQSGGSPLYIEELCHAAAAGGDLASTPRRAGVAWLNALVASRLERLPEAQAQCLRLASVAGHTFAAWLLERLTDAGEDSPMFAALVEQDFLIPAGQPGMLRFKHALTRDAVYATVDPAQRRALHLRVAQALEAAAGEGDAFEGLEALSYHFDAAGVSEPAARFAEAAGDKALGAMALDRARAQYITALRSLDGLPTLPRALQLRWCGIAQKLGQTCVFDPLDISHGLLLFERAAHLAHEAGDTNTLARAEYWLGYVNYGKGRPREAVRHCEAALAHALASDDQRLAAQVRATLGQSLASAGRYGEALPLLAQAVQSKRQHSRPGNNAAIGSAYTVARTAYTLGDLGRFDEAQAGFDEALRLLGEPVHSVGASVRELMCAVYLWQGRWEDARRIGLEGAEIALRCRSRYLVAMGRALAACGGWALRRDAAALQALREPTHWIEARGGAVSTSLNYGWLVEAAVELGLEKEAREHATRLFMRARAQDRHGEAMGCRALARLAASRGESARARRYLDAADRAAEFRGSPRERAVNRLARAEMAAGQGRLQDAREGAEIAAREFESMGMGWYLARAQGLLVQA